MSNNETEPGIIRRFATEIRQLSVKLNHQLKQIEEPFHATMVPTDEELYALFLDSVSAAVRRANQQIEDRRELEAFHAHTKEADAARQLLVERGQVLEQFEAMARAYRGRPGRQDFSAIGELMQSILGGERVWGEEGDVVGEQVEAWCNEPMEATAPPRDPDEERDMKRLAQAEVERHEKRQAVKDEQNLRLSAASIARDVVGERTITPLDRHTREFFELAKALEKWLAHGDS